MTLENAIERANEYAKKDLRFSELKYRELIYAKTGKAVDLFWYADTLRQSGYYKKAEELFLSIPISKIPIQNRHHFYLHVGMLYQELGNFAQALHFYKKSLKLNSESTVPYVFVSNILKIQEKDKVAIVYLTKALLKEGDIDEVYYNLATSYIRIGKLEESFSAIEGCLKIDSTYPNAKKIKQDIKLLLKQDGGISVV